MPLNPTNQNLAKKKKQKKQKKTKPKTLSTGAFLINTTSKYNKSLER